MAGSNRESSFTNPMFQNFEFNLNLSGDGANILGLGYLLDQEMVPHVMAALITESAPPHRGDPLEQAVRFNALIESRERSADTAERALALARREQALHQAGLVERPGTGWEDVALIAAGEQISLAQYGPSDQVLQNTCLAEPEFVAAAGPPPGQCRQMLAALAAAPPQIAFPEIDEVREWMAQEPRLRAAQEAREIAADAIWRRLQQQLMKKESLCANLVNAFDAWGKTDPVTQTKLLEHITNAHQASSANVRVWQIVCWFQTNVPQNVADALQALSDYYYQVALLKTELTNQEGSMGNAPPSGDLYTALGNDESCAVFDAFRQTANSDYRFGYVLTDGHAVAQAFGGYSPRGEGAALAQHCLANLQTRLVRLSHASSDDKPEIYRKIIGFAFYAERALDFEINMTRAQPDTVLSKSSNLKMLDTTRNAVRSFLHADVEQILF